LRHIENFLEATGLITPAHIVPEWYFLPFYAVLRSVPNKLGGIFLIFMFLISVMLIPFLDKGIFRSGTYRPLFTIFFWNFLVICLALGWIGGSPVIWPFNMLGQFLTFLYFFLFVCIISYCLLFWSYIIFNICKLCKLCNL